MRERPVIEGPDGAGAADGNVLAMPNVMEGRLADLLAAAGGPGQDHELRGELAARTAFRVAADSWPTPRRRLRMRRGPAVVAATTMATLLVATTGLSAASVLPGSAGRTVDGILGSVGVDIGPQTTPAAPAAPAGAGSGLVSAPALHAAGSVHVGCSVGGSASNGASGPVQDSSCVLTAPHAAPGRVVVAGTPAPAARPAARPATTPAPTAGRTGTGSGHGPGVTRTPSTPPTTLPGGGTSRGGNQGVGGGSCKDGSGGSTTTTTDPSTTTTTDPTTGTGCDHGAGHHHGPAGGQASSGDGTAGTSAP